jgi:hypothetical protein
MRYSDRRGLKPYPRSPTDAILCIRAALGIPASVFQRKVRRSRSQRIRSRPTVFSRAVACALAGNSCDLARARRFLMAQFFTPLSLAAFAILGGGIALSGLIFNILGTSRAVLTRAIAAENERHLEPRRTFAAKQTAARDVRKAAPGSARNRRTRQPTKSRTSPRARRAAKRSMNARSIRSCSITSPTTNV